MKNKLLIAALIALTGSTFINSPLFAIKDPLEPEEEESLLKRGNIAPKPLPSVPKEIIAGAKIAPLKIADKKAFINEIKSEAVQRNIERRIFEYQNAKWHVLRKEPIAKDPKNFILILEKTYHSMFALNREQIEINTQKGTVRRIYELTGLGKFLITSGIAAMAGKIYYDTYGPNLPEGFAEKLSGFGTQASEYAQKYSPQLLKTGYEKTKAGLGSAYEYSKSGISQTAQTGYAYGKSGLQSLRAAPGQIQQKASQYTPSVRGYFSSPQSVTQPVAQPAVQLAPQPISQPIAPTQGELGFKAAHKEALRTILP